MKRTYIYALLLSVVGISGVVAYAHAQNSASTNFQSFDQTLVPSVFSANSANFHVDASLEPVVGGSASPNFNILSGVGVKDAPTAASPSPSGGTGSGGGGGGNGGLTTTPPTLEFRSPTFKSTGLLQGNRGAQSDTVFVNGSTNGVDTSDPIRWTRTLPLFLGKNDVRVEAQNTQGIRSSPVFGTIDRLLIGDINTNRVVDDVDLSLFTRAWKRYTFFADFNEDGSIDDVDLSLFASHWGASY